MATASALTAARASSVRTVTRDKRPLAAGAKVYKGSLAIAIVSGTGKGYYKQGVSSAVAIAVGRFTEDVDNTSGGAGDLSAEVHFFRERNLFLVLNDDSGTPVAVTDRELPCYVLNDQVVTMATNTSLGGMVYDVTSEGVWVEVAQSGLLADPSLSDVAPVDPSSSAASAGVASAAARQDHLHHIALATPAAEGLMSAAYASAIHQVAANVAAIKAIAAAARAAGMVVLDAATGGLWKFHASSTASDTSDNLVLTPDVGSGRWLRADSQVCLSLPVTKDTADNATIFTVPVGARLHPTEAWWDVTTSWTGGTNAAIGVHASPTGWTTKGDILGGATGDVLATLVSTNTRMVGTIGTKLDTRANGRLILIAADTLKFDRIADAFTAGAGNVRVLCDVLANLGA